MKYKVFRDLLLVEIVEVPQRESTIILPDTKKDRFVKLGVLGKGPDVKEDIEVGDIIYAEKMLEPIDSTNMSVALILSKYVMYREKRDGDK